MAFVGAAVMLPMAAFAAIWQGGAEGDIKTPANWDGDITTTGMNFTKDVAIVLTQGVDAVTFRPWGAGTKSSAAYQNATVTFDMGGHTLWATEGTTQSLNGNSYSTWIFTNGVFRCTNGTEANAATNIICDTGTGVGMSVIVSGADTTFIGSPQIQGLNRFCVINGAKAYGQNFYLSGSNTTSGFMTNVISSGASVCFDTRFYVGTYSDNAGSYQNQKWHDALTIVDNATLTSMSPSTRGGLAVGYGQCAHDNTLVATNGAKIYAYNFYLGYGVATNNIFKATGADTEVRFYGPYTAVGGTDNSHAASGNSFILEKGAKATANVLYVAAGGSGTNNLLSIRSGATMTASTAIGLGMLNNTIYGKRGRIEVVGEGSKLTQGNGNQNFIIGNHNADVADAHELFVCDGGSVDAYNLRFYGNGNKIVLSNGTVNVKTAFYPHGRTTVREAANSVVHIEGSSSKMTVAGLVDSDTTTGILAGAPICEFVIPEGGWTSAPFVVKEAFTISDDTRIRIDEDSARAYAKQGGGMVPLFSTDSTSKAIAADLAKLSIGLPKNCSLTNESGVLSVKITKPGLVLFVR